MPEAMALRSSPMTSERMRFTTVPGARAAASRPPLMAERCLRTQLISRMEAPQPSSTCVVARLSSRLSPAAGAQRSAEPPPEVRPRKRVRAVASAPQGQERLAPRPRCVPSGTGWAASRSSIRASGSPCPVFTTTRPPVEPVAQDGLEAQGHARAGLACPEGHDAVEIPEVELPAGRPDLDAKAIPLQPQGPLQHGDRVHPFQGGSEEGAGVVDRSVHGGAKSQTEGRRSLSRLRRLWSVMRDWAASASRARKAARMARCSGSVSLGGRTRPRIQLRWTQPRLPSMSASTGLRRQLDDAFVEGHILFQVALRHGPIERAVRSLRSAGTAPRRPDSGPPGSRAPRRVAPRCPRGPPAQRRGGPARPRAESGHRSPTESFRSPGPRRSTKRSPFKRARASFTGVRLTPSSSATALRSM